MNFSNSVGNTTINFTNKNLFPLNKQLEIPLDKELSHCCLKHRTTNDSFLEIRRGCTGEIHNKSSENNDETQ